MSINIASISKVLSGVVGAAAAALEFVEGDVQAGIATAVQTAAQSGVLDLSEVGASPITQTVLSSLDALSALVKSIQAHPTVQVNAISSTQNQGG